MIRTGQARSAARRGHNAVNNMDDVKQVRPDPELEQSVDAALRRLPDLEAPATLVPNVLALLEARARQPWWQRPWFQWPRAIRLLSVAAVVLVVGSLLWVGVPAVGQLDVAGWWQGLAGRLGGLSALWKAGVSLLEALRLAFEASKVWVLGCAALLVTMYLAGLGMGTACVRVVMAVKR